MASTNSLFLPKRLADNYFGSGTFKMLLVSSVPSESDFDSFDFRSDITNEVTGSGYTAGGFTVVPTVSAVDTTNNRVSVSFADLAPALASATVSAVGGWIYKDMGSAATDQLVQFVDFGGTVSSTSAAFNVDFTSPLYVNR
jgi:hypothetical protein